MASKENSKNSKSTAIETADEEEKLKQSLAKLIEIFGFELEVSWTPKFNSSIEGEIIGKKIYIYSENFEDAKMVLVHEYLENILKMTFSKPYVAVINKLLEFINQDIYKMQEKIIENIAKKIRLE